MIPLDHVRSANDIVDLAETNFMAAFGIRSANTREPLDDPNMVEFVPYISQKDKG
jgi:hypothetical protein